jgi:hypothetical protein
MMCPDQISYYKGAALAAAPVPRPADVERFQPWDSPDLVALMTATPKVIEGGFGAKTANEAAALFHEGPRGPTARSAAAKQIAVERRLLRFAESLLGVELERFARGKINERRLRTVETIADRAHRRYLSSYRLLLDMEAGPVPSVKICADRAAFQIDARVGSI